MGKFLFQKRHLFLFISPSAKTVLIKVYYYFHNLIFLAIGGILAAIGTIAIVYYQHKANRIVGS